MLEANQYQCSDMMLQFICGDMEKAASHNVDANETNVNRMSSDLML